jgi:histone H3/H4
MFYVTSKCSKFTNQHPSLATVQKIVTEILPPSSGLAFGKDARDLLIECCVEFITLISSEANEISEKESKKTIACEHITKALEQLGFGEYVQDIMEVASEHKEQLKVCPPTFLMSSTLSSLQIGLRGKRVLTRGVIGTREEGE